MEPPRAAPAAGAADAREQERLRVLRSYAILDTPPEAAFERITRLAACVLEVPISQVSLVDEDRQWIKASCGLRVQETPRSFSFCSHALLSEDVMVVPDAALDPRFADNPLVTGPPFIRFYAGAPLRSPDGQSLGSLCVIDPQPRSLDASGRQTLRELAAMVMDEFELRRVAAELRREIGQRERAEASLSEALRSVESQVKARTADLSHSNDQLRASELQFRELAENIKEVFWMSTADSSKIVYVSPAFETIWGRPAGDLAKLSAEWLDTIHPEDRTRVSGTFVERAVDGLYEEEYRVLRPDGTERWVHDRGFAIRDDTGRVYRIAGVATDITERRQQQAVAALRARQQQAVAELGAFALTGGAVDDLLTEAVRTVKTTLGIDYCGVVEHDPGRGRFVARAGVGIPGIHIPVAEIRDGKESAAGYALLTGQPVIVEDTAAEKRFRQSPWVHDSGVRSGVTVLIGGDGTHLPSFGTLSVYSLERRAFSADDVFFLQGIANVLAAAISRRRSEEACQVAKEEAELANSAKSNFLSRISHELRTPLNAILGFGQLLQMDAETERHKECVKHILAGGQQLLAIIDDVLDISRLEVGQSALALEPVLPRDAVALGIDMIRPLAAPRRVSVDFLPTADADKPILVNRQRFNQILLNLLSNAVKYNVPGGRVTVACQAMPSARLRISISDTGPGIAPDHVARLFVPFDRLGAERTDVQGTGLGLALCKNLVEAQGGHIGVKSAVGQGSTFWIQLPLAPPGVLAPPGPAAAHDLAPAPPPAPPKPAPPLRRVPRRNRQTILYFEDNHSNLLLIQRLLGRYPRIRLLTAALGQEGLDIARRRRLDLILLDLHLPDLSGLEVLAALQADPATRAVPVVVISADALPANIEKLRRAGAYDYLTKPLDCQRLMAILAELA